EEEHKSRCPSTRDVYPSPQGSKTVRDLSKVRERERGRRIWKMAILPTRDPSRAISPSPSLHHRIMSRRFPDLDSIRSTQVPRWITRPVAHNYPVITSPCTNSNYPQPTPTSLNIDRPKFQVHSSSILSHT